MMLRHTTAILIGAVAAIGVLTLTRSADAEANTAETASDDVLPIVKVAPVYPSDAILKNTEGDVLIEFVVTEMGTVRDPVILDAEPPGVFDQAAIDAVLKFKYKPKVVDGKPTETAGVRHRIVFEINDDASDRRTTPVTVAPATAPREAEGPLPIVKVAPIYPQHAIAEKIEGHVLLEFVVTETGAVRDPVILDSMPRSIFDQAALDAVAKFRYEPKVLDGKPQETAGVRNRIVFEISD